MNDLPHLTIAYMTNRREPKIHWFLESLMSPPQTVSLGMAPYQLIAVDFYKDERDEAFRELLHRHRVWHAAPKPCVWQGPHRLTKQDYFAASNARNTALCMARDGWIAYVDDLSVLTPTWLSSVFDAMREGYIALGAYQKVFELCVEDGVVKSFRPEPTGVDHRVSKGSKEGAVPCGGQWLYGCSLAAPVEALLAINGWDEDCDGMGTEDYIAGLMLEASGWKLKFDVRMFTYESQEGHDLEPSLTRIDKGSGRESKAWTILNMVKGNRRWAPNYFDPDLASVRKRVLDGEPFPIRKVPENDWYDGQPLREM